MHDELHFKVNLFDIFVVFDSLVLYFKDLSLKLLDKRLMDVLSFLSQFFHFIDFFVVCPFDV